MPDWTLIFPILFPPLAALAWAAVKNRFSDEVKPRLGIGFAGIEILLVLLNLSPTPRYVVFSSWDLSGFTLALQLDGVRILLLLLMVVPLLAERLIAPPQSPLGLAEGLILSAAMIMTMSLSLQGVYVAWVIMDLVVLGWRIHNRSEEHIALQAFALSQLAGIMLVGGDLLSGTTQSSVGAFFLAVAFWARLGLFPFHWVLPQSESATGHLWIMRAVPMIAGASLWLQWWTMHLDAPTPWIGVMAALACLAAATWAWRAVTNAGVVGAAIAQSITCVPLAIAYGEAAGTALGLWITLSTLFALALFDLGQQWPRSASRLALGLIRFAAICSLAQVPLTPGFLGRWGLETALWERGEWLILLIIPVTTFLILLRLFTLEEDEPTAGTADPQRAILAGAALLGISFLFLSLAALPVAAALAPNMGESSDAAINRVIRTNDLGGVLAGFLLLFAPIPFAFVIRPLVRQIDSQETSVPSLLGRTFDLNWFGAILAGVGYEMGRTARNLSAILEENPIVWILFIALWIAIFVLIPR